MKYGIGYFIWILLVPGAATTVHQSGVARVDEPQPASVRISHDILAENEPLSLILFDILRGTGVHGGFVEMTGCSDWPKGHLEVKQGTTLREAMAAVVAANPNYQWDLEDDVVNLMPRDGVPLLRTRIAKFQMDATDSEIRIVLQDLLRLPEVREREAALGLQQGPGQGPGLGVGDIHPVPRQPVPVHINLRNLSLQDAFNKIIQASPKAVWIYHQTECNGAKTYTVEVVSDY
jgi:hypothetical protein